MFDVVYGLLINITKVEYLSTSTVAILQYHAWYCCILQYSSTIIGIAILVQWWRWRRWWYCNTLQYSGVVVQSVPTANAHVQDERFHHILRRRHASRGLEVQLPRTRRAQAWVERASEGNRRDAPSVSFATEPLHGLFCKRRWRRVCYRHNWVRNALAATACRASKPSSNRWS